MPSQATSVDAQLVLQLYDLRREEVMRAAWSTRDALEKGY